MKKYLLLILLAVATWISPVKLHALTADDFVGKIICQLVYGNYLEAQGGFVASQDGRTYSTKNSDTQVVLHNFYEIGWELTFNISGNSLVLANETEKDEGDILGGNVYLLSNVADERTAKCRRVSRASPTYLYVNDTYGFQKGLWCYKYEKTAWTGTYKAAGVDGYKNPRIEFPQFKMYISTDNAARFFEKTELFIVEPNATQTYIAGNDEASVSKEVALKIQKFDATSTTENLEIVDFLDRGMVAEQTTNPQTSLLKQQLKCNVDIVNKINGTIGIPKSVAYDAVNVRYAYYDACDATNDGNNWAYTGDLLLNSGGGYVQQQWWWGSKAGTAPTAASQLGASTGTVALHDPFTEGNQWAEDKGGTYKRYVKADIHLNDFYQWASTGCLRIQNWTTTANRVDITPTVSNDLARYGYGAVQGIYVGGKLTLGVNRQYFDHAELWLVPGRISSVSGRNDLDATTGLTGAINITEDYSWFRWNETGLGALPNTFGDGHGSDPDWASQWPQKDRDWMAARLMAAPNDNGEIFYNHLVSPEKLGWDAPADNATAKLRVAPHNDYTVFAKVYYTPESGLQPTFHGLASSTQVTGIDDITVKPGAEATEIGHYDLQGRRIDATTPGVHIIRMSDGTARKSVVK